MNVSVESDPSTPALSDLLTLREVADMLPRRRKGRKTNVATLYRWTSTGCRGVKLRYLHVGATRCVTRGWLDEFFAALTEARQPAHLGGQQRRQTPPSKPAARIGVRTAAQRRRDHERAERELAAAGI